MKKRRAAAILLMVMLFVTIFPGGGSAETAEHEPISICVPQRDLASFEQVLKKKYPEINLEVVPYSGQNSSAYLKGCLKTGNTTDIFFTTYYTPGYEGVSENLLDLSGYDFTNNYTDARLRELMDDGALYLLPAYYNCYGITYNKKILEDNGWTLPKNLDEMAELKEKAEAAGYNFALTELQYPGYGFQYLCNIADTDYLSTLGGR